MSRHYGESAMETTQDLTERLSGLARQRDAEGTVVMTAADKKRYGLLDEPHRPSQVQLQVDAMVARLNVDRAANRYPEVASVAWEPQYASRERRRGRGGFLLAGAIGALAALGGALAFGGNSAPDKPQAAVSASASPSASVAVVELPTVSASASPSATETSPSAVPTSALPKVIETSAAAVPPASPKPPKPSVTPTKAKPSPTHSSPAAAECWTKPSSPDPIIECRTTVIPVDVTTGSSEPALAINPGSVNIHVNTDDVVNGYVEVYDPTQHPAGEPTLPLSGWIPQADLAG